jgi:hypothetical protein
MTRDSLVDQIKIIADFQSELEFCQLTVNPLVLTDPSFSSNGLIKELRLVVVKISHVDISLNSEG